MRLRRTAALLGLVAVLLGASAAAAAADELKITNTTWGWNPATETITATGSTPESQFPAVAVNQPILIKFDEKLNKSSIKEDNVFITSVGADELTPLGLSSSIPGGMVAPVVRVVKGNKLMIEPAHFFLGSTISFGFAPKAYYYLEIRGKGKGPRGQSGSRLKHSIIIGFRTTDVVADPSPGPPVATVTLFDPVAGNVKLKETSPTFPSPSFLDASTSPPPQVQLKFNELVLPSTLINPSTGVSTSLDVALDVDDDNRTVTDRLTLPGGFVVSHTRTYSVVDWISVLPNFPPDALYVLNVEPTIEDIVGNSRYKETGDIGDRQTFAFRTIDVPPHPLTPIVEEFDNQLFMNKDLTSADWAKTDPGRLKGGAGGGTGDDGPFVPTQDTILNTSVFDPGSGKNVQRVWNFTRVEIAAGVTVRAVGEFPLEMRTTGSMVVDGTLDLSGAGGEQFTEIRIEPGEGGVANGGGGGGGRGGSVTDGVDVATPLFAASVPGYQPAAKVNQGLTGLSSLIEPFELTRANGHAIDGNWAGLWLQPNTGTGSIVPGATPGDKIHHNHPTFSIINVTIPDSAEVVSTPSSPLYFGRLDQPGLDIYEFPPPPIAKAGDPFLIGDLAGHEGAASGFPGAGGKGSLPLTVAQSLVTQVRSGGGGGGGGRYQGVKGEDSPPAGAGDQNTGTAGGAAGGGVLVGAVAGRTATVLTAVGTPFQGLDLAGGGGAPPFIVFPNSNSGYVFEIVANTSSTVTIAALDLPLPSAADTDGSGFLDFDDVPAGGTFRIEPGFDVGGNGGGGSGVHLAGTVKLPGPPNLTLPTWTPGAGGGAGGVAAYLEAGGTVHVRSNGKVLLLGGEGGRTTGAIGASASGGGGGGGGTLRVASADTGLSAVVVDGLIDCTGGAGGIGFVEGGKGGDGRARFESRNGTLQAGNFPATKVKPSILPADIGFMIPGLNPSLGASLYYFSKSFLPSYDGFTVTYSALVNGVLQSGLTYTLADLKAGKQAPFDLTFNDAGMTPSGQIDPATVDQDFVADVSALGLPFVRFRLVIFPKREIGADVFSRVSVESLVVEVSG